MGHKNLIYSSPKCYYDVIAIAGFDSTIIRLGKAWSWGRNDSGELGNNTIVSVSTPIAVCGNHVFCKIAGSNHRTYIAIDNNNKSWGWGYNGLGNLAINSVVSVSTPVAIYGTHIFNHVKGAYFHFLALDSTGAAWCWGQGTQGEMGNNLKVNYSTPVAVLGNHVFCKITAGRQTNIGLTNNGLAWSWGRNLNGVLGNNVNVAQSTPVAICGNHSFIEIETNMQVSIGIDNLDQTWVWGRADLGALGDNTLVDKCTPVLLYGNHVFKKVAVGWQTTFGLDKSGILWSWGNSAYGELGLNNTGVTYSTPVAVLGNHIFKDVIVNQYNVIAIDTQSNIWSWGRGDFGQIGDNSVVCRSIPVAILGTAWKQL